jgi:hypothetical protein
MPTFTSNIASRQGKLGAAGLVDPALYQGTLRYAQATVVLPGTTATNDILELAVLPQGAQVIPSMSQAICHADPGTTLRLNIGTAASAAAYSSAMNLDAGGVVAFTASGIPTQTTTRGKLAQDTMVQAVVTNASTITANSTITFLIAYIVG